MRAQLLGIAISVGACGLPSNIDEGGEDSSGTSPSTGGTSGAAPTDGTSSGESSSSDIGSESTTDATQGGTTEGDSGQEEPWGLEPWGFRFVEFPTIEGTQSVAGDFDGDGCEDIWVQTFEGLDGNDRIFRGQIYLGACDGTLALHSETVLSPWFEELRVGDFTGDGHLDVAAFHEYGREGFYLALNDGLGGIATTHTVALEYFNFGIRTLDANRDGLVDLLLPGGHSDVGQVAVSDGLGGFVPTATVEPPACYFSNLAAADLDGDGWTDLVGTGSCNSVPPVLPFRSYRGGAGGFETVQTLAEGPGVAEGAPIHVVDVDADGDLDAVTAAWVDDGDGEDSEVGVAIFLGDGTGAFAPPAFISIGPNLGYDGVLMLQLDATNPPAFLFSAHPDSVLLELDGTTSVVVLDAAGLELSTGDFDSDGRPDVISLADTGFPGPLGIWLSGG